MQKIEIFFENIFMPTINQSIKMSVRAEEKSILEYCNVSVVFENYIINERSSNCKFSKENFDENMTEFDEVVNEKLEEGWRPLGPPSFSISWFDMVSGGLAVQTLVRDKNIEPAVVVDVRPDILIAECVKPLRSSKRFASR